jgi:hypothetical protein
LVCVVVSHRPYRKPAPENFVPENPNQDDFNKDDSTAENAAAENPISGKHMDFDGKTMSEQDTA